ncbi:hypothetical protein ABPG74_008109 [Tetrahymena malaccensis]
MKSKVILALFALVFMAFSQTNQSGQSVECAVNQNCTDDGQSCGMAGVANNWESDGNNQCKVIDCTQLQNQQAAISNYACKSCNGNQGNSQQNSPAIFSNSAGNNCVSVDCSQKATQGRMNDNLCEICVGQGSKVNYDKSTCIPPNSVLSASIVHGIATFLAFLFSI